MIRGDKRSQSGGRARRVRALVRKEFRQIMRDPSSILIAFAMPLVLLILFGYGVSLDAKNVPVAVVIEAPTPEAHDFLQSLAQSHYFRPQVFRARQPAESAFRERDVQAIVVLRENFARDLEAARRPGEATEAAHIQVILNGTDSNTANLVSGYIQGAWQTWLAERRLREGISAGALVEIQPRVWFNPELRSTNFLVPGLIAIIMTLIGALLTALVVAREWERGTMEALIVSPVSENEILLGKLIPYFALGIGAMALSVTMSIHVFDVPFRGHILVLGLVAAVFLAAALGLGLLISTATKNQFLASQMAIIVTFLPAFLLSGFIFDITSMPGWVQALTYIVPARYFVACIQTLFLAGDAWSVLLPNLLALAAMAVFFLALTRRKTRKTLE